MQAETEKVVKAVTELIKKTQTGEIKWRRSTPPERLKGDAKSKVETVYITEYEGKRLRLYREYYLVEENRLLPNPFDRLSGVKYPYWDTEVYLEIIDKTGATLWPFPQNYALEDLLSTVRYEEAEVDDFLNALIGKDVQPSNEVINKILDRISKLERDGVVAAPDHFKDIADEPTIRNYLSQMIQQGLINGALGSIIKLTPAGQETLRTSKL